MKKILIGISAKEKLEIDYYSLEEGLKDNIEEIKTYLKDASDLLDEVIPITLELSRLKKMKD